MTRFVPEPLISKSAFVIRDRRRDVAYPNSRRFDARDDLGLSSINVSDA
jgi:hypothetical protein